MEILSADLKAKGCNHISSLTIGVSKFPMKKCFIKAMLPKSPTFITIGYSRQPFSLVTSLQMKSYCDATFFICWLS